jgi:hypothetical protein
MKLCAVGVLGTISKTLVKSGHGNGIVAVTGRAVCQPIKPCG